MSRPLPLLALLGAAACPAQDPPRAQADESPYYTVEHLPLPEDVELEVGGMAFLSDGRLVVSTRRGQVWLVENALGDDLEDVDFSLFAEGLLEGLGLAVVDDVVHVVQRTELSRLIDADGDGRCDRVEVVSDAWGASGNYHEFAYGLPRDRDGNFYVSLNVGFFSPYWYLGQARAAYRGWILQVAPDGTTTPWASGFRSPDGLGTNHLGELFATDNQGDWMPVCPLHHVERGGFYGHPASLAWTPEFQNDARRPDWYEPAGWPRKPPAVWFPYGLSRSTGNVAWDSSGGRFGPFERQLFAAELTNGLVARCQLEKVRGAYQGTAFLFRTGTGSAHRVCFAPDGTLMVGLTNRGWGGAGQSHGLARVRFTGETPMEMHTVHLLQDGFEVTFTLPLADIPAAEQVAVTQYDYHYHWKYGSEEQDRRSLPVTGLALSRDRRTLTLRLDDLRAGYMTRLVLDGVASTDGRPLLHNQADYTLNQLPRGPLASKQIARVVEPPRTREQEAEGWLELLGGNSLDAWHADGFAQGDDPELTPDKKGLSLPRGTRVVAATAGGATLRSRFRHRDARVELEVFLPEGGAAELVLAGRYPVPLTAAMTRGPGQWTRVRAVYRTPARLEELVVDGKRVDGDRPLTGADAGAAADDVGAEGALGLRAVTPVAFRNVRIRALRDDDSRGGWVDLLGEDGLQRWTATGHATWRLRDGVVTGEGRTGHLFSPRGDYRDFELRAACRINTGGNSGLYFRAQPTNSWPQGYEAQINRSFALDPVRTGSLYHRELINTTLIEYDDTWFDYHVTCRDEAGGTRIVIRLNGVVVVDHLDTEREHGAGHIALQQHHQGSVVQFKDLRVRELR